MKKPNVVLVAFAFGGSLLLSPQLRADDFFSIFQPKPPMPAPLQKKPAPAVKYQTTSDPDDDVMPATPILQSQSRDSSSVTPIAPPAAPEVVAPPKKPVKKVQVPVVDPGPDVVPPVPAPVAPAPAPAAPPPVARPKITSPKPIVLTPEPAASDRPWETDHPVPPANIPPTSGAGIPLSPPPVIVGDPLPVLPPKPKDEGSCNTTVGAVIANNVNLGNCIDVAREALANAIKPKPAPVVCAPLPDFPAPGEKKSIFNTRQPIGGQDLGRTLAPRMSNVVDLIDTEQKQTEGCPQDCVRVNQAMVFADTAPAGTQPDPDCPSTFRSMPMNSSEVSSIAPDLTAVSGSVSKIYTEVPNAEIFEDVGEWTKGIVTAGTPFSSKLGDYMAAKRFAFGSCPAKCSYKTSTVVSEKPGRFRKIQTSFVVQCGPPKTQDAFTGAIYMKNNWSCKAAK
jgi:hypothetical protein